MDKLILDVTCGDRTIWFQKNEPHTIYCDKRREEWEGDFGKALRADGKTLFGVERKYPNERKIRWEKCF